LNTVLKYPGSKWSTAQWIISNFPPGYEKMTYLEPFFGSGAIFFNKKRSVIETINDLDGNVVNLFKVIRDNPGELASIVGRVRVVMKNTLGDLNNHLFAQLERLNDEELKGDDLREEIERAKAVTQVASKIIENGSLVLEAKKMVDDRSDANTNLPKMLEG
jgi:site-specific DNA-adenine methylase